MAGLGNPLSAPLGGGPTTVEIEFAALLDAYQPSLNPLDPVNMSLSWAEAIMLANIWASNERISGQIVPLRMMESMVTWEQACSLVPLPGATDQARRQAIAAQFLGFSSNAFAAIEDAVAALAGAQNLGTGAPAQLVYYGPGINPGPPGFEWSSDRPCYDFRLTRTGTINSVFLDLIRRVKLLLSKLAPAWNLYSVGTYDTTQNAVPAGWNPAWDGTSGVGFTPGVSVVGVGLL